MVNSDTESEFGRDRRSSRQGTSYNRNHFHQNDNYRGRPFNNGVISTTSTRRDNERPRRRYPIAVVVGIKEDQWILRNEDSHGEIKYLIMTHRSKNVTMKCHFPKMRQEVEVRSLEDYHAYRQEIKCGPTNPSHFISSFHFQETDRSYIKQEVVAVAEVNSSNIQVVGLSFANGNCICESGSLEKYKVGQLLIGDVFKLPSCVLLYRDDVHKEVFYMKRFDIEQKVYNRQAEPPERVYYIENLRPLSTEEEHTVLSRCANISNLDFSTASRYIQEPHIAVRYLEGFIYKKIVEAHLVLVDHRNAEVGVKQNIAFMTFIMNLTDYKRCFQSKSNVTWRKGGEIQVTHVKFSSFKGGSDSVTFNIKHVQPCGGNEYKIHLTSTERSTDFLKHAFSYPKEFRIANFIVCPIFELRDSVIDAIRENFESFFEHKEIFDHFSGRRSSPLQTGIADRDVPFYVKGKPLDDWQLDFMRSAADVPGFTCAQAPPGCGKTHSTAALVANLAEQRVHGGILISGTTNAAVTNAVEALNSGFPEIKVVRNYSLKADSETATKSLKQMAKNAEEHVDIEEHPPLREYLDHFRQTTESLNEKDPSFKRQMEKFGETKNAEKQVVGAFMTAYDIHVFATTVQLLIRSGDIFNKIGDQERSAKRLILDEAAQMSPIEALALYCSFPNLTHITLLGDMKQLGPHSLLPSGSLAARLVEDGELTRMFKLNCTTRRDLNTIYRCHPMITQKFLIPIYGEQMKSGVTEEMRNLAKLNDLPVAQDGSPCLLIHTDGKEENNVNREELDAAMDLLYHLQKKCGVQPEDIVIICNHRGQTGELNQLLSGKGNFGVLKTEVAVHTVDSFQGKEAKVIIVLTTKTCRDKEKAEEKLQFIGDRSRGTVAVSRAQHALYILGDMKSLVLAPFWRQFMPSMIEAGGIIDRYFDVPETMIDSLRSTLGMKKRVVPCLTSRMNEREHAEQSDAVGNLEETEPSESAEQLEQEEKASPEEPEQSESPAEEPLTNEEEEEEQPIVAEVVSLVDEFKISLKTQAISKDMGDLICFD